MSYDRLLTTAHEAVDHAVKLFNEPFEQELDYKNDRDFATSNDHRIETELQQLLARATPDIGFLGEEHGHVGNQDRYWCLDPIDGTVNYSRGNPLCAVSLALIVDGQPTIGVIDLPRAKDRYWATNEGKALKNGREIRCSATTDLSQALVSLGDFAVGEGSNEKNKLRLQVLANLAPRVLRIRMLGSAATDLAWVADGQLDAAVIVGGHSWDLSAGRVIAGASGCQFGATESPEQNMSVVGTPELTDQIQCLVVVDSQLRSQRASRPSTPP